MNWDLLGHEWAVDLLREHVARGRVRHAYLFTGPQGIGRRTLALRLGQALNCTQPPAPGEACHQCRICQQIARMQHADLFVVQAEQQGGTLKVDQVRELQHSLALTAYEANYRIAILLRFEEANASAMNALLKTLEEPAERVLLILTAESAESLLPTIVSRCEVIRLRPLSLEQVRQGLQDRWEIPEPQAKLVAHLSAGRPGYALGLAQEPERLEQRSNWLDEHWRLLSANRVDRFVYAEGLTKQKDEIRPALSIWLSYWRDVMLCATGASTPLVNLDRAGEIERLAVALGIQTAQRFVTVIERILYLLERNVNPRLALETLMLDLPRINA